MTPELQRIKIAEACGIHVCPHCRHLIDPDVCHCKTPMNCHGYDEGHSGVPMGCTCGYNKADEMKAGEPECPDYLGSLDAIAGAVACQSDDVKHVYAVCLSMNLWKPEQTRGWQDWRDTLVVAEATPPQRCKALLKALFLWTE